MIKKNKLYQESRVSFQIQLNFLRIIWVVKKEIVVNITIVMYLNKFTKQY